MRAKKALSPTRFPFSVEAQAMADKDLLPSLLFKLNENQMALEAAITELVLWVE